MSAMDRILDAAVVTSFDATGFRRHAASFSDGPHRDLSGRHVLVTGGTAGIGLAAAAALAERGARPLLWGRNPARGEEAAASVPGARFQSVDLSALRKVQEAATALPDHPAAIVLNAGSMPLERRVTEEGHELMWASQVLGHMVLLRTLRDRGALADDTRIVWVSSGGGLTVPLGFRAIDGHGPWRRHAVYAKVKRAQIELAAEQARRWPDTWVGAMHPGWVDTAAVRHSMPWFHRLLRHRLRTPEQGADSIVWLVSARDPGPSGRLWFDRAPADPHAIPGTRPSPDAVEALWERVQRQSSLEAAG